MTGKEIAAYRLASEIEWTYAKQRAALITQHGRRRVEPWQEYDAHAATELGSLILARLS